MVSQIQQFSKTLTEVQEQSRSSASPSVGGGLEEKKEEGTLTLAPADATKLLSMADIFELAIGAAARGAVSYCVSEVEARYSRQEEEEKRVQLEKIKADQVKSRGKGGAEDEGWREESQRRSAANTPVTSAVRNKSRPRSWWGDIMYGSIGV